MYVSSSQRRRGVGTWLMNEAAGTAAVALQAYRERHAGGGVVQKTSAGGAEGARKGV